jgi:hypothetical protein
MAPAGLAGRMMEWGCGMDDFATIAGCLDDLADMALNRAVELLAEAVAALPATDAARVRAAYALADAAQAMRSAIQMIGRASRAIAEAGRPAGA